MCWTPLSSQSRRSKIKFKPAFALFLQGTEIWFPKHCFYQVISFFTVNEPSTEHLIFFFQSFQTSMSWNSVRTECNVINFFSTIVINQIYQLFLILIFNRSNFNYHCNTHLTETTTLAVLSSHTFMRSALAYVAEAQSCEIWIITTTATVLYTSDT